MSTSDHAPILEVSDLSAGYGETTIIRQIDLVVGNGETVVVIGPNGHGKTTLLRAISGLIRLRSGAIIFDGELVADPRPEYVAAQGLVHVPQGDHLFPDLTVEENLAMGAFPRRAWRDRATAFEQVYSRFPTLYERRRQSASTLSGGERRQVALGRGLMRRPRLLLIDEPSLGLAPIVMDTVYDAIAEIAAGGTPILLVEENLEHVQELAVRVHVLEMGRIVRTGTASDLAADETVARSYLGTLS